MPFPYFRQLDAKDCGPTCLRMVCKHYGNSVDIEKLRQLSQTTRSGSNLQHIAEAAETIGFKTLGVKISLEQLADEVSLPAILHWNQNHFVVVYKIKKKKTGSIIYIADPGHGLISLSEKEFLKSWIGSNANNSTQEGIALLLEPTAQLKANNDNTSNNTNTALKMVLDYIFQYRKLLVQLLLGFSVITALNLLMPFFTQNMVDIGVQNKDIAFVNIMLVGQLIVFLGSSTVRIIQSWLFLYLGSRINLSLISDFFIKLMRLPLSFFDSKLSGDIMQRITDHSQVQALLTSNSMEVMFSAFEFIIYGAILLYYNENIFLVFLVGSVLYLLWVVFFLRKRKGYNYKNFAIASQEQSKIIELINGMQEIKLHNAERRKRWSWERIKIQSYKLNMGLLRIDQAQNLGSGIINQVKNLIISYLVAKLVIDGQMSLGMMLSVSYITGQLNAPLARFVAFAQSMQSAKLSLERISEIHNKPNEEEKDSIKITEITGKENITLNNVSFCYPGYNNNVLENVSIKLPTGQVTAIVGASGSGKTTLMKLLMKFYEPTNGEIKIDNYPLSTINTGVWREHTGSVLQDGYIFNDTIANNIAVSDELLDLYKLNNATYIANIDGFIHTLPMGSNTIIGNEGMGISGGQKQRILIARAVYKNPDYIFLDEATSALDAQNENEITHKLQEFYKNKTVIIVAHRLSTVKNAHQIIVLDKGKIAEVGSHAELTANKNIYYNLVKNQLELGS